MKLKTYKIKMEEAFAKESVLRVIHKTCLVLSRRIGKRISPTDLPMEFIKADGRKLAGVFCSISNGSAMRFNWKLTDKSCEIISIDYWGKIKRNPDFELITEGQNIIQIIDAITDFLVSPRAGTIMTEDAPVSTSKVSPDIAASIRAWSEDMNISDKDLENRRIAELYSNFEYWYKETGLAKDAKYMSNFTFRNYIMSYLAKFGIRNIFMRTIKTVDGGKEKIIISDKTEERNFDTELYKMTLADKVDFAKQSIRMLAFGLQNALIFSGGAGVGKSKMVSEALASLSGMKVVKISGGIKTPEDLYKVFYDNNSPKTIILFDDTDTILGKNMLDLMKAAMAPDTTRTLSWFSNKINNDKIKKNIDDIDIAIAKQQGYDIKRSNVKEYPTTFKFDSKIIIITNRTKTKIDSAISSRGSVLEFVFSKNEIIDDIRKNINNIFPEYSDILTTEMKLDALNFIEQYSSSIAQFDYRIFKTILGYRALTPEDPNWKKWSMVILRAG